MIFIFNLNKFVFSGHAFVMAFFFKCFDIYNAAFRFFRHIASILLLPYLIE